MDVLLKKQEKCLTFSFFLEITCKLVCLRVLITKMYINQFHLPHFTTKILLFLGRNLSKFHLRVPFKCNLKKRRISVLLKRHFNLIFGFKNYFALERIKYFSKIWSLYLGIWRIGFREKAVSVFTADFFL